jgi:hypothetical protein
MPFFNFSLQFPLKLTSSTPPPYTYYHHQSEPTILETFSRTVRTYVPSSIPIASTPRPTPPRVSKPVSFGRFMNPSAPGEMEHGYGKKRSTGGRLGGGERGMVFESDDEGDGLGYGVQDGGGRSAISYPRSDDVDGESIMLATWDTLNDDVRPM